MVAIVGLLSDSHGRAQITRRAVELLVARGAEVLIHLGDVCGEQVIEAMVVGLDDAGRARPAVHMVYGNCDFQTGGLTRYAEHLGVIVHELAGRLELDGKTIVLTHGHMERLMRSALAEGVDYLCHGHTHVVRDDRIGPTRVINPGALFRAAQYTVGLLDTAADHLEIVQVPPR